MKHDDHYSSDNINARAADKQREDNYDFNNEIAGRDTGKISRFIDEKEKMRRAGRSRNDTAERVLQTQLQMLLDDPVYASAYNNVMDMLREAEQRTQAAIDDTERDLAQNDQELEDIQSRASTLPDGTRVYRDANGDVFNEDGEQIHAPETDAIVWREDNPSHEEYLANRERDTTLRDYLDRLRDYQTRVLGTTRDRMMNPDDPPSLDDLDGIEDSILDQEPPSKLHESEDNIGKALATDNVIETQKPSL